MPTEVANKTSHSRARGPQPLSLIAMVRQEQASACQRVAQVSWRRTRLTI